MNTFCRSIIIHALLFLCFAPSFSGPRAGFFLPDSIQEVNLIYRTTKNLIILPVTINDTIHLNLILDTGSRNLILFGKKFMKQFTLDPKRKVQFSGLGEGSPIEGNLALNNRVSIGAVLGEQIPIIIIPQRNIFNNYKDIHGIIGYEIFIRFEIELNPLLRKITFRPAFACELPDDFTRIPLQVEDSRPYMEASVSFPSGHVENCKLMIDTGSSLGLLLKTTSLIKFSNEKATLLGTGLNGPVEGIETRIKQLNLPGLSLKIVKTGIIFSPWNTHATIGMGVLDDYTLILNYCRSYAGLKKC